MTTRSIRRAAERMSQKADRKAAAHQTNQIIYKAYSAPAPALQPIEAEQEPVPVQIPISPAPPVEAPENPQPGIAAATARAASQAQIDANRANSQLSSGPKTEAGKAISSQNRRSHGFAGGFEILPWEDAEQFVTLRNQLRRHYQAVGAIEQDYVNRLAEHTWLRQRALQLQLHCYDPGCDFKNIADEKQFALLMRYQNQNERAIDRCVNQLLKLQTVRREEQIGFESEIHKKAAESRKNEAHDARLRLIDARAKAIKVDAGIRQTVEVRVPGNIKPRFNEPADAFRGAIRDLSREINEKETAA